MDLNKLPWQMQGWRPYSWKCGPGYFADIPPMPVTLPSSAQAALQKAGYLPDWKEGVKTRECEWVEHRHWEFFTDIEAEAGETDAIQLCADGLDYSGWILIDKKEVASFRGALVRHKFDLRAALHNGRKHRLSIVFDTAPEELGQVGYTSRTRFFKPRYNYSWDWCPRFVPIGIWDALTLQVGKLPFEVTNVRTELSQDLRKGTVTIVCQADERPAQVHLTLKWKGKVARGVTAKIQPGKNTVSLEIEQVEIWWPNGEGSQPQYDLSIESEQNGDLTLAREVRVGFKHVDWLPCEGAPKDALPWICQINQRPIFLQGFNWVPISLDYHTVKDEEYAELIEIYREAGCNILRVWGGAFLEKEVFYRLCDEAGILVWQEFPLSSSFIENWPPEDPAAISDLEQIARDYVRRRAHHVSKLLWCGGNELQSAKNSKTGTGIPCNITHPALAAMGRVVEEEDPGVRYVPTSSSGPRFMADEKDFGKGLHHDVHGPWNLEGSLQDWEKYWRGDDSLIRTEVGCPAAADLTFLEKYCGMMDLWPPDKTNPFWMHTSSWWMRFNLVNETFGHLRPGPWLDRYHQESSKLQMQALGFAALHSRKRFPQCGGFIVWMGHDPFPCAISIALLDADHKPREAFLALSRVFNSGTTRGVLAGEWDQISQEEESALSGGEGLFETVTILKPPEPTEA